MTGPGKLYLIPTVLAPDTDQQVIAPMVRDVIMHLDHFIVENVKTTRRYISRLQTGKVIESLHFFDVPKKGFGFEDAINYLMDLSPGTDIGFVSEAGCPGVADPGALFVEAAHQLQMQVVPLPGPSSILMALMASGFNGQNFAFHGYLPIDQSERKRTLKQLAATATKSGQTQIFMETPYRNNALLKDLLQTLPASTKLCIACNISAQNEMIKSQSVGAWKKKPVDLHKLPAIFLIGQ